MQLKSLGRLAPALLVTFFLLDFKAYGQTDTNWHIEVVDSGGGKGAGAYSSLAIDRLGNLHLVYSDFAAATLRYAFRAKGEKHWDKTTVDAAGGSFEGIAVDSDGRPHVAYNSPKQAGLRYARWNGKQWDKFVIDAAKTNRQISIQLDSHNDPHISYYQELYSDGRAARSLKYAYFDGVTWYVQTVDHRSGTGAWNSLALDREEHPHISYSISSGYLGFASGNQTVWNRGLADFVDAKGKRILDGDNSLAIGADGAPRIAYVNTTDRTVNFSRQDKNGWHPEIIDSLVATGADADRVALKLDRNGLPQVIYYDSGLGSLKFAFRDSKGWHTETIDNGNGGQFASLSLNEDFEPYVSYYTTGGSELRLAHRLPFNAAPKQ